MRQRHKSQTDSIQAIGASVTFLIVRLQLRRYFRLAGFESGPLFAKGASVSFKFRTFSCGNPNPIIPITSLDVSVCGCRSFKVFCRLKLNKPLF
jgi:hypothetical protein